MDHREIIQKSMDYIEDNLKTEITAAELAETAGFSLFHYYRLFQSATGLPVMQYILRRRLLHGVYAIRCGSTKTDAALMYGFDTYAGFYKAFLREFGCTPSAFAASCRARRPYRLNLLKEEHMTVTHKKAAQILTNWNLETEPITDIYNDSTGVKNDNACSVGDRYILKFTTNLGKLKNHISLSKAIQNIGLYAAAPIPAADGSDYVRDGELYFYLTKSLPGTQMTSDDLYKGDTVSKARFVGEIIGQLHLALNTLNFPAQEADIFETAKNWALPKATDLLGLSSEFCQTYLDTFGSLHSKLPRQIIHRDPNPGNIIRSQDTWGFLDFELSEQNVRIYDPCYAATAVLSETFSGSDPAKLDTWLEICKNILLGYDSVVKLTSEEWEAVPYVILTNQMICVAWFADQEKYAELLETNKRMTEWLVESFDRLCPNQ